MENENEIEDVEMKAAGIRRNLTLKNNVARQVAVNFMPSRHVPYKIEVWRKIFQLFKEMPHLWDKNNENYLNKPMREKSFRVLLEVLKEYDKSANLQILKKRMENFRSCFMRELKKVKASIERGCDASDIYVPTLWYFNQLSFLAEDCELSQYYPVDTFDESADNIEVTISTESENASETPQKKKSRKRNFEAKRENDSESEQPVLPVKEEEWEITGKSIAIQLRGIKQEQLTICNKLIADAIYYARLGKLTLNSAIDVSGTSNPCYFFSS